MTKNEPSVQSLLNRGDVIAIITGRLSIVPASGKPVPDEWLATHTNRLVIEIVERTGLDVFIYESYSTGRYGKARSGGVSLQFKSLLSEKQSYMVFNAALDRAKTTSHGKKGSPLPKGRFRVGRKSGFVKFWRSTGLKIPARLSSFHDYMGNLGGILFTGSYSDGEKLDKQTVRPVELSHDQLLQAFSIENLPYNSHTNAIQTPYKSHTKMPYKESVQSQPQQGIQANPTTGETNCGIRLQGSTGIRENITPISTPVVIHKSVQDQSIDEWSDDYSSCD
ncbi:MAG: hypothetical protein KUG53_03990 [Pseudomonadales bacterium]|nr:hypothetical protein [Pseudomonadales bacterium]